MATFRDSEGRDWDVRIDVAAARRVRDRLSVSLVTRDATAALQRILEDPFLLCDVLFVLVEPQARDRGVTDEEFGRALFGDVIDQATKALLDAFVGFTPNQRDRALVRQMIDATLELADKTRDRQEASIREVRGKLDQIAEISLRGATSTDSPASPASTPPG